MSHDFPVTSPGALRYFDAPKPRKVALVGTAPSSIHAPIKDESWEIWGVGFRGEHMTRVSRWFELHRLAGLADGPEWYDLMKKWGQDCELWMIWPEDLGPNVKRYPIEDISAKYGTFFMTSSFAWMLALAIEEKVDEIGIWGVDMEFGTEYREQRAGVRHFIELAKFSGITVTLLASGGVIYQPIPYPLWQDDPLLQKLNHRKENFTEQLQNRQTAVTNVKNRLAEIAGAKGVLAPDDQQLAKLAAEERGLRAMLPTLEKEVAWCQGSLDELAHTSDYLKP